VFNPAVTIANPAVTGFWLFLPSFAHGDFWLAIVTTGLNAPAYWNGIRWIFEAINPAVTINVHAAEAIQIGGFLPNFPHGKHGMFHICGLPIGAPRHPWLQK
jgi:hypothetical protein